MQWLLDEQPVFSRATHYFLSNDNLVIREVTARQHFILLKCTESLIKWLSTTYMYNVLFCEQLTHISVIFQYYQHITVIQHKLSIYTNCVMALILVEFTNSSCEAAPTALNIINLDLLLVTLCTGSSSLRGDEQHDFYCTNSSEPNSSKQR